MYTAISNRLKQGRTRLEIFSLLISNCRIDRILVGSIVLRISSEVSSQYGSKY